jgi:hypothetical protein
MTQARPTNPERLEASMTQEPPLALFARGGSSGGEAMNSNNAKDGTSLVDAGSTTKLCRKSRISHLGQKTALPKQRRCKVGK